MKYLLELDSIVTVTALGRINSPSRLVKAIVKTIASTLRRFPKFFQEWSSKDLGMTLGTSDASLPISTVLYDFTREVLASTRQI